MMDLLLEWDKWLFLKINGWNSYAGDLVMKGLSFKHTWIIYVPFLVLVYKRASLKRALILLGAVLLTFAVTDLIAARVIKPCFQRLRPCHDPDIQPVVHLVDGCGGQFGFISNHAANHFGLALLFGLVFQRYYPRTARWFMVFAFMVSYSRVYIGVHYPGDVLGGAILGLLFGYLIYLGALKYFKTEQA